MAVSRYITIWYLPNNTGDFMKLLAATGNKHKIKEISRILSPMGYEVITPAEMGIDIDPEETGLSFLENATIKAKAFATLADIPVLADDSGLEVDALGGEPGIYSSRYAEGTDADRVTKLLKNMEGQKDRSARFVCEVVMIFPDGKTVSAKGECKGTIAAAPAGDGGFGYDPVFYMESFGKTMAELTEDEKNSVSHRGNALENLRKKLT